MEDPICDGYWSGREILLRKQVFFSQHCEKENEFRKLLFCQSSWGAQVVDHQVPCRFCDQRSSIREPHHEYEVSICLHEEFVTSKLVRGMSNNQNWREITLRHKTVIWQAYGIGRARVWWQRMIIYIWKWDESWQTWACSHQVSSWSEVLPDKEGELAVELSLCNVAGRGGHGTSNSAVVRQLLLLSRNDFTCLLSTREKQGVGSCTSW